MIDTRTEATTPASGILHWRTFAVACLLVAATVADAERLQLIQDGSAFSQAISQQQKSEFAKAVSVKVTKVTVGSANKATVIFTLLLDGSPALPNQTGYAIRENGTWKVAGATFCSLLSAQGAPPPVCTTASATALPG